ncbi:calcium-binding protein [Nonomuraea turcica]|uniref:calcium-binding protein n=1 Tax=Nonomuraea sp. G32 TaxID=3067274 RepID=UPI00273B427B|nr:calcium-binding protein [Nonomuraea sp. G32]MDP4511550.1 calcium-binding protein [Nonomuraea sp. G32]
MIRDSGDVVQHGAFCEPFDGGVRCNGFVQYIQISLGDQDDVVSNLSAISSRVFGGDGNDRVDAGDGNSRFMGGPGNDTLNGGQGNDILQAEVLTDGADTLIGRGGVDAVDYSSRVHPLTVSLDGAANDGVADEGDNIGAGVENIVGGRAGDVLRGDDRANQIDGGIGDDTISGLKGDDKLNGNVGSDVINGGPGNDTLSGPSDNAVDTLSGDTDTDTCNGGAEDVETNCEL